MSLRVCHQYITAYNNISSYVRLKEAKSLSVFEWVERRFRSNDYMRLFTNFRIRCLRERTPPFLSLHKELYVCCHCGQFHKLYGAVRFRYIASFSCFRDCYLKTSVSGLCSVDDRIINECGAVCGMRTGRGNRSTRRKTAAVPQIPHDLNRNRTRAAEVGEKTKLRGL
jgi:hypothetical protein